MMTAHRGIGAPRVQASTAGAVTPISAPTLRSDLRRNTGTEPGASGRKSALDSSGDLFIADENAGTVREIKPNGIITAFAGNGGSGASGDGGQATAAELFRPYGVAVDSNGDVFVADASTCAGSRTLAPNGVITTVAGNGQNGSSGDGGPATAAELFAPVGVATDSAGDLFILDRQNRIREVNHATGVITTVAGNSLSATAATAARRRPPRSTRRPALPWIRRAILSSPINPMRPFAKYIIAE